MKLLLLRLSLLLWGAATVFFSFFGVQLVYTAATFDGEGSLGHVGMYIAAVLYPVLAIFFGACSYFTWRRIRAEGRTRT